MDRFERYIKLTTWARKRYTQPYGILILSSLGKPSKYTRIVEAADRKYLNQGHKQP
jgi:hypothetical protein